MKKSKVAIVVATLILIYAVFNLIQNQKNLNNSMENYSAEVQGRQISFLKPASFDISIEKEVAGAKARGYVQIKPIYCGDASASLINISVTDKNKSTEPYGGGDFEDSINDYLAKSGSSGSNYELKKIGETDIGPNHFYEIDSYSYGELWGNQYVNFSTSSMIVINISRRNCTNSAYESNKDTIQKIVSSIEI